MGNGREWGPFAGISMNEEYSNVPNHPPGLLVFMETGNVQIMCAASGFVVWRVNSISVYSRNICWGLTEMTFGIGKID